MKKIALLFSATILFAGLTFAQTPQTQDKAAKPAEKKEAHKHDKSGCDEKTKAACSKTKDPKGCCDKSKKAATETAAPEKK